MLNANVRLQRKEFRLEVELTARSGEPLVIVGESGAGKTTFLETVAGLTHPDSGRIAFGSDVWFNSDNGIRATPAHERPIGYVAQEPTLFPHMNVIENVAFGLRASGMDRAQAAERAAMALGEVRLQEFATRKPDALSGGQRQRITLARALCLEPKLFLLDEPLSSLDIGARQDMRAEIRQALERMQCVTVYVTHDPLEALSFGERIAVVEGGRITQVGTRADLLREPRSQYIGRFVGINVFRGSVTKRDDGGGSTVSLDDATLHVADLDQDGEVYVAIAPQDITLSREAPTGSARNVLRGRVEEIVPALPVGDRLRVQLGTTPPLVAEVTRQAADGMGLAGGVEVYAAVKATGVRTYR